MSAVTFGCSACGHEWASPVPTWPRLVRSGGLSVPLVLIGLIGGHHNHAMYLISGLGVLVGAMAFTLITPICPACGSEFTRRRRHSRGPHLVEPPPGEDTRKRLRTRR